MHDSVLSTIHPKQPKYEMVQAIKYISNTLFVKQYIYLL